MRAWRTSDGWLVEVGPTTTPVITTLRYELGWEDINDFLLLDANGIVRERFGASAWSFEDDLGAFAHAVENASLVYRKVEIHTTGKGRVTRQEGVMLRDLREASPEDLKTIEEALARDGRKLQAKQEKRQEEGRARVAAIPGATEDFGAGDSFRRAQEALCRRVEDYGHLMDSELLRGLARFGTLHRSLGNRPRFVAALEAFATACRLAAFDYSVKVDEIVPPNDPLPAGDELKPMLEALELKLLEDAEGHERFDSNVGADQCRRAAEQVARARALLG